MKYLSQFLLLLIIIKQLLLTFKLLITSIFAKIAIINYYLNKNKFLYKA